MFALLFIVSLFMFFVGLIGTLVFLGELDRRWLPFFLVVLAIASGMQIGLWTGYHTPHPTNQPPAPVNVQPYYHHHGR